jgi:hypothetical protein
MHCKTMHKTCLLSLQCSGLVRRPCFRLDLSQDAAIEQSQTLPQQALLPVSAYSRQRLQLYESCGPVCGKGVIDPILTAACAKNTAGPII